MCTGKHELWYGSFFSILKLKKDNIKKYYKLKYINICKIYYIWNIYLIIYKFFWIEKLPFCKWETLLIITIII